jgi:hypothetical protein
MERASGTSGKQAVRVKPFERGNIRHTNSIEIYSLARTSPTQGRPGIEDLVGCERMARNRAERIIRDAYNRS